MSTELEILEETPTVRETPNTQNTSNDNAIEKAREQERAKLYKKIQAEEDNRKAAEAKASELEARVAELIKFKEEKELEKLSELEKLQKQLDAANKAVLAAENAAKEKDAKLAEINRVIKLKTYRDKIIKESGLDTDFEDSVYGDSEEELDESLEKALAKVERIKAKYTVTVEPPKTPRGTRPPTPAPTENETIDLDACGSQEELDAIKRKLRLR